MGAWWRRDRSGEGKRGETMSEHAPEHKATEPRSADQPIDPMPAEGAALEERIGQLVAELEDAKARTLRVMADYHNYQRRSLQNEDAARREGIAAVVASVVPVLDHFDIALSHTGCGEEGAQIMSGVRVIREELLKALAQHGVRVVSPAENDEFEPGKHEAVMQRAAEGIQPGRIVQVFQAGYVLGTDRVLRPAKVVVAPRE
jgi:molecular chaperone GrpE